MIRLCLINNNIGSYIQTITSVWELFICRLSAIVVFDNISVDEVQEAGGREGGFGGPLPV